MRALNDDERAAIEPLITKAERAQQEANAARAHVEAMIADLILACDAPMGHTLDVSSLEWVGPRKSQ